MPIRGHPNPDVHRVGQEHAASLDPSSDVVALRRGPMRHRMVGCRAMELHRGQVWLALRSGKKTYRKRVRYSATTWQKTERNTEQWKRVPQESCSV